MKKWLKEHEVTLIALSTTIVIFLGIVLLFFIGNVTNHEDKKSTNKQAEELVIDISESCDYGTLTVLDRDNDILHQYSGKIDIKNDGKDGEKIEIIVKQP